MSDSNKVRVPITAFVRMCPPASAKMRVENEVSLRLAPFISADLYQKRILEINQVLEESESSGGIEKLMLIGWGIFFLNFIAFIVVGVTSVNQHETMQPNIDSQNNFKSNALARMLPLFFIAVFSIVLIVVSSIMSMKRSERIIENHLKPLLDKYSVNDGNVLRWTYVSERGLTGFTDQDGNAQYSVRSFIEIVIDSEIFFKQYSDSSLPQYSLNPPDYTSSSDLLPPK